MYACEFACACVRARRKSQNLILRFIYGTRACAESETRERRRKFTWCNIFVAIYYIARARVCMGVRVYTGRSQISEWVQKPEKCTITKCAPVQYMCVFRSESTTSVIYGLRLKWLSVFVVTESPRLIVRPV